MMLTREQAWELLCDWTHTDSLRKHARAVEVVMRQAAYQYGEGDRDVEQWGIAGLLHDADYEQWYCQLIGVDLVSTQQKAHLAIDAHRSRL